MMMMSERKIVCLMREEEGDCEGNRAGGREERSQLLSSLRLDFKGDIDAALIPSAPPVCGGRGGGGGTNRWRRRLL